MYALSRTSALVLHACATLPCGSGVAAAVISSARERIRGSRRDPRRARPPTPTCGKVEGVSRPTARTHTSKSQPQRVRRLTKLRRAKASRFGRGHVAGGRVCGGWVEPDAARGAVRSSSEDIEGKSGRRPGRHLQVEASGPGNAAGVQPVSYTHLTLPTTPYV